MFARANALNWGFLEKYTSAQANFADAQWPKALDAIGGGTYVALAPVSVGGTWGFSGDVLITGTFASNTIVEINGGATLRIDSGANADFKSGADGLWENGSTLTGNTGSAIFWSGASTFSIGISTFNNNVLFQAPGAPHFANGALFDTLGTVTLQRPVSLQETMTLSGTGHVVDRNVAGSDSNASYGINDGDFIHRLGNLTTNRNWTILNAGATDGAEITIYKATYDTFYLNLQREDASSLGSFSKDGTESGLYRKFIMLRRISGQWVNTGANLI